MTPPWLSSSNEAEPKWLSYWYLTVFVWRLSSICAMVLLPSDRNKINLTVFLFYFTKQILNLTYQITIIEKSRLPPILKNKSEIFLGTVNPDMSYSVVIDIIIFIFSFFISNFFIDLYILK
jgi:hypothetical protein